MKLNRLTAEKKKRFLEHLAKHGNVSAACLAGGISRTRMYQVRNEDEKFAELWNSAEEIAVDLMILEAKRRAQKGTRKPVFHQGRVCGHIKEYSDSLLMFLIKGKRPEYATERREIKAELMISHEKALEMLDGNNE